MDKDKETLFEDWLKKTSDPVYRNSALIRLTYIYRIYKLPTYLCNEFKNVLWSKENLNNYGLPNLGEFFCICGMMFPHDGKDDELLACAEKFIVDQYKDIITSVCIKDITTFDFKDDDEKVMNKLTMRQTISKLAHILYIWFKRHHIRIPDGVAHWKAIAENPEEFAEIGLAWE